MSSVRVKICGITNVDDAMAAVDAGVDAIGLNMVGGPRQIDVTTAEKILSALPPFVTPVVLARIEDCNLASEVVNLLGVHWVRHVQVYGEVTPGALSAVIRDGLRPIPAIAVRDEHFADGPFGWMPREPQHRLSAVHLDAYDPEREGGTGKTFCWEWLTKARDAGKLETWPAIILAAGLCPDNIAEAVRSVRPYAVDVSSGVEAEPGRKDPDKMRQFVEQAKSA